jgi:quinoprotein glucose dehydrogenase
MPFRSEPRSATALVGRCLVVLGLALACGAGDPGPSAEFERARSRGSSPEREWRTYLGDRASSQHTPLVQIDRNNVSALAVAWTYASEPDLEPTAGTSQIQFNPLVVKGVLYGASPTMRLFALDASTGDELWTFQPPADLKPWSSTRGAVYWEDGSDERILFGAGQHLYALDARTGCLVRGFGSGGSVDLRDGLGRDVSDDIMGVTASTPGALFEDLLIVGSRVNEVRGAAPGHVRAYDVRTGEMQWIFRTIPHPGEFGYETWPEDAWQRAGGANAWAGISVDPERGLVFIPTGSAVPDFYGADREGDNLFANTLLALDARTGERRWHYQVVRHDIWDRDLPSPPNLVEIERDGRRIPAVAQVTKTGDTFVFHRETGEPLFPIREEAVGGAAVSGEFAAVSQPLPVKPPPVVRHTFSLETVTDRTPEATAAVTEKLSQMQYGSIYTPASVEGTIEYPGLDGGAEWGGAAWDAATGLLFVNANQVPWIVRIIRAPDDLDPTASLAGGYLLGCGGCHGADMAGDGSSVPSLVDIDERMGPLDIYRIIRDGRGRMPAMGGLVAERGAQRVGLHRRCRRYARALGERSGGGWHLHQLRLPEAHGP